MLPVAGQAAFPNEVPIWSAGQAPSPTEVPFGRGEAGGCVQATRLRLMAERREREREDIIHQAGHKGREGTPRNEENVTPNTGYRKESGAGGKAREGSLGGPVAGA
jgi:hypothetical protein